MKSSNFNYITDDADNMHLWRDIFDFAKMYGGKIDMRSFINFALYSPKFGYYCVEKGRVGKENADFYTAASLKRKIFPRLMKAAIDNFFKSQNLDSEDYKIVEIGAERGHPIFENSISFSLGDNIEIPEKCVLISNELLDARPFDRFRFFGGQWKKTFFAIEEKNGRFLLSEIFENPDDDENSVLEKYYSRARVEEFSVDTSSDAREFFDYICSSPWRGFFLFADYFRSAEELCRLPNGTARTYRKHSQGDNIAEAAGETDITFSPCSDEFTDIATFRGFRNCFTQSQESFFVSRAADEMSKIMATKNPFDSDKRELAELISPVHMGDTFRIIGASRF